MRDDVQHADMTEAVISCAFAVYNEMGFGFLESVSQRALASLLQEKRMDAVVERALDVRFRGKVVGEFRADLVVNNTVIVEVKSTGQTIEAHEAQLVNYLNATGLPVGLLINFGPTRVDIKRRALSLPSRPSSDPSGTSGTSGTSGDPV